jgi:hypothetical protein
MTQQTTLYNEPADSAKRNYAEEKRNPVGRADFKSDERR